MTVYKFGGASVSDAAGIRNLCDIVSAAPRPLFVIVSAMGKTTNSMERVLDSFWSGDAQGAAELFGRVREYHDRVAAELLESTSNSYLEELYSQVGELLELNPLMRSYEVWYDRIVSYGELLSSTLISQYLDHAGAANKWVDMREVFVTTARHRDADIDIESSTPRLRGAVTGSGYDLFVGQGFIGATPDGAPTTIGREGSDYSAAVTGYILDAEGVTIWKDVPGVLNGDPKIFPHAVQIPQMSYLDAIELAYSGAQIIHPKTIKPLQNKGIPLYVRSFTELSAPGTVISDRVTTDREIPIFILKRDQILLTVRSLDLSFVIGERLSEIFTLTRRYNVKVNLIQNSAVNLHLSVDHTRYMEEITTELHEAGFRVTYNTDMELLTVMGYRDEHLAEYAAGNAVHLCQRTRRTLRVVRKH